MNFIGSPQMGQRGGVDVSENMPRKIGPLARRANSGDIHKGTHRVGAACTTHAGWGRYHPKSASAFRFTQHKPGSSS